MHLASGRARKDRQNLDMRVELFVHGVSAGALIWSVRRGGERAGALEGQAGKGVMLTSRTTVVSLLPTRLHCFTDVICTQSIAPAAGVHAPNLPRRVGHSVLLRLQPAANHPVRSLCAVVRDCRRLQRRGSALRVLPGREDSGWIELESSGWWQGSSAGVVRGGSIDRRRLYALGRRWGRSQLGGRSVGCGESRRMVSASSIVPDRAQLALSVR